MGCGELGAVAAKRHGSSASPRGEPAASPAAARPRRRLRSGARLLPSWRMLLVGWVVVVLVAGAYAAARETPMFAIRQIDVQGVPAPVADVVRSAVGDFRGASLVGLDGGAVVSRVDAVPAVYGARYDRAFPHTLRIVVRAEQPVAVLRAGRDAWVVSATARVLAHVPRRSRPELPRIWIPASAAVAVGTTLDASAGGAAARTLAPLARSGFPARITSVSLPHGELVFQLAQGTQLRFGKPEGLRLKLAVARRIVRRLPLGTAYLDVSVPERPVAGSNTQVSG